MADAPPAKHTGGKFRKGVSGNPGGKRKVNTAPQQPQAPQPSPQVGAKPQPHAEVEQPVNASGKRDTRFKPGNPGKPKGTRHHATRLATSRSSTLRMRSRMLCPETNSFQLSKLSATSSPATSSTKLRSPSPKRLHIELLAPLA
jgi:hypothetical protein